MKNIINYSFKKFLQRNCNLSFINTIRNDEFSTSRFNYCLIEDVNPMHFSNSTHILTEELILKNKERTYRKMLLNELFDECSLSGVSFLGVDKEFLLAVDIDLLKNIGFLKANINITDKLLSYLEPFPYKEEKNFQSTRNVSIGNIRNSIEKQYLAWKFNVDIKLIDLLYKRFNMCMLKSKSIRSIKRNLEVINQIPQTKSQSIGNKVYLLNLAPFNVQTLLSFKSSILGISWDDAVHFFPEIMKKPYSQVLLIIKIFQNNNFTTSQIKKALPVLPANLLSILNRLNYVLSCSKLSEHRKELKFLKLLSMQVTLLSDLIENQGKSYLELLQIIDDYEDIKVKKGKVHLQEYWYQLQKNFKTTHEAIEALRKHPNLWMVPEIQIIDTVKFIKQLKFSDEELMESITIILYPRKSIKMALENIDKEKDYLETIGFVNGHVPEETHFFKKGSKLRNKTLQLCLYYIEKKFNFSGSGVFSHYD